VVVGGGAEVVGGGLRVSRMVRRFSLGVVWGMVRNGFAVLVLTVTTLSLSFAFTSLFVFIFILFFIIFCVCVAC
jgi:hypothetical protein